MVTVLGLVQPPGRHWIMMSGSLLPGDAAKCGGLAGGAAVAGGRRPNEDGMLASNARSYVEVDCRRVMLVIHWTGSVMCVAAAWWCARVAVLQRR